MSGRTNDQETVGVQRTGFLSYKVAGVEKSWTPKAQDKKMTWWAPPAQWCGCHGTRTRG